MVSYSSDEHGMSDFQKRNVQVVSYSTGVDDRSPYLEAIENGKL